MKYIRIALITLWFTPTFGHASVFQTGWNLEIKNFSGGGTLLGMFDGTPDSSGIISESDLTMFMASFSGDTGLVDATWDLADVVDLSFNTTTNDFTIFATSAAGPFWGTRFLSQTVISEGELVSQSRTNPIITPKVVPLPAAVWLFGSGLLGLIGLGRRNKQIQAVA